MSDNELIDLIHDYREQLNHIAYGSNEYSNISCELAYLWKEWDYRVKCRAIARENNRQEDLAHLSRRGSMKAVLVVDAPKNCLHCNFCIRDKEYPKCKLEIAIGHIYNTTWEKLDSIPDWCPLKEVPCELEDSHGYNAGWNDAIRAIVN